MDVAARALFAGDGLGEEARAETERCRDLLDGELEQRGIVRRLQTGTRRNVELEQPGARLRVDGAELDPQSLERRPETRDEVVEAQDLADAVADPARERLTGRVAQPDLVLERGQRVVAELGQCAERASQDFAGCGLTRTAVRPERRCETDAPAEPPGQLAKAVR